LDSRDLLGDCGRFIFDKVRERSARFGPKYLNIDRPGQRDLAADLGAIISSMRASVSKQLSVNLAKERRSR